MANLIIHYTVPTNEDGSNDETVQALLTGFPAYAGQEIEEHPYEQIITVNLGDHADTSAQQEEWLNKNPSVTSYSVESEDLHNID